MALGDRIPSSGTARVGGRGREKKDKGEEEGKSGGEEPKRVLCVCDVVVVCAWFVRGGGGYEDRGSRNIEPSAGKILK